MYSYENAYTTILTTQPRARWASSPSCNASTRRGVLRELCTLVQAARRGGGEGGEGGWGRLRGCLLCASALCVADQVRPTTMSFAAPPPDYFIPRPVITSPPPPNHVTLTPAPALPLRRAAPRRVRTAYTCICVYT